MKKYPFLFLLGMGTFGAGMGGIYSSFANQETYIERLFQKIKEQILDFSNKHALSDNTLKNKWLFDKTDSKLESKEQIVKETINLKNTLDAFIYFWFGLIILNSPILKSDVENEQDLNKFINDALENELKSLSKEEFMPIYKNMKEFATLIEIKRVDNNIFIPYLVKINNIYKPNEIQNS